MKSRQPFDQEDLVRDLQKAIDPLLDFFADRLKVQQREAGVPEVPGIRAKKKLLLNLESVPLLPGIPELAEQGVRVVSDMEEDMLGSRWWQFRAFNSNDFDVCVQVTLDPSSQTSGHSMVSAMSRVQTVMWRVMRRCW